MAKKREDFDSKYKWNIKDLYNSTDDFKKDIAIIAKDIKKLAKFKGNILSNADSLYKLLKLDTDISKKIERVYIYAHINNDADTLDTNYQEQLWK